jgi:UDP-N-acetylmuramoylalanine--D-glutamate ligase
MEEGRYSIHRSKKSQIDKDLNARESLRKNLANTAHRLDSVGEKKGVEFISDTRSVDLLSTRDSFKCIIKPIVWLTAPATYDRDYSLIESYLDQKIKSVVVYGSTADDMRKKIEKWLEHFEVRPTLEGAVLAAYKLAKKGDVVLFSPSCTTPDEYANFADRGAVFKKIVQSIN